MNKHLRLNKILTKHRNIILLLVTLFCNALSYAQCPTGGNITFSNQTDIDNFSTNYPGCTALTGALTIDESVAGNITNLSGLTALTSVGGTLTITSNTALTSLSGLHNITSVGGNLFINLNVMLSSLSGLDNVASIGGYLYIEANTTLSNLNALSQLTSINGLLLVKNCPALTSLSGLDNITFTGGYIRIQNNAILNSLSGLTKVISVGGYLTIDNNDALTSLSGLDNIASINGVLTISNNAMITSLSSLDNIAPAGITNLIIQNNSLLSTCEVASICSYLGVPANTATITGNATGCSSRVEVENACYTTIPDANFEQKLIDLGIDTQGGPTDGWILTADAEAKTGTLDVNSSSISDLTGIEAFINITKLFCQSNLLTSMDVSHNTALVTLHCYSNQLSTLDISQNTVLVVLWCQSNQLSNLDVSQNTALKQLVCNGNQLTSLDVSLNMGLTGLFCQSNLLTSLDVSMNTALHNFRCQSNQLTSLDVRNGNNTNFTNFNANNNSLTCISVDDPAWSTINWTNIDSGVLFSPSCDTYTAIPNANFEQKLIDLGIDTEGGSTDGWILTADAEAKTGTLDVSFASISDLTGIEAFINITTLECRNNQLTSLDVTQNTGLKLLFCGLNQLTSLDVTQNTSLIVLAFDGNQLTSLDLSQNTALKDLYCYSNQLTSLDVSQNTALTKLFCYSNQLSSLDVSLNTALTSLYCYSNQLTSLDVSQNIAIHTMYCYSNQLTSLDVSLNIALLTLYCQSNQLTNLDVSQNTVLKRLRCYSNQLTSLDVRNGNNTNFTIFDATSNSLTCISVDDPTWSTSNWTDIDAGVVFSPGCDTYTAIPDINFEQKLIDLGIDTEGAPTDGWILTADAEAKTGALQVSSASISDLTGIEAFINVTQLNCHSNQLTNLDVSQNTALTYLNCHTNQLTSLDVSLNTALKTIYCQSNQLSNLDVSLNTALIYFSCSSNQLTSLDVSMNTALKDLRCNSNQLTSLDVRNGSNTNITYFNATSNSLTCISVDDPAWSTTNWTNIDAGAVFSPGCDNYTAIPDTNFEQKLIDLGIDTDGFTGWILTADAEAKMGALQVSSASISDLTGIEAFINVTQLYCHSNQLTSLDVSLNTALTYLNCRSNQLSSLDVSLNTALKTLYCHSNQLSSLDVSLNTALIYLICSSNQLSSLDVSLNTVLKDFRCNSNQLSSLDIRNGNNTNFTYFNATNNSLTCISVDDPTWSTTNWTNIDPGVVFSPGCDTYTAIPDVNFEQKLIDLGIDSDGAPTDGWILTADAEAQTGTLDVSSSGIYDLTGIEAFINITQLFCHYNQLTSLDVSHNISLTYLYCNWNQLTSLDVSLNTALITLYCRSNQLTSLDISQNTALEELQCNSNQLTSLDVSQNTALLYLSCYLNQLTSLDVSLNTALTGLNCYSNQLTSLDVSLNTALHSLVCFSNQLTSLDVRNGNTNFQNFLVKNNSLTCISVSDPAYFTANIPSPNIDPGTYFGSDCLCPSPAWSVPSASSTSITSDASCIDADGWTHYLNSGDEEILLSLEIGSSGAVVPRTAVTLDPDGATDVFWVSGVNGNFINNPDGAAFMKRKWDVTPTTQPSSSVGVRFYYTTDEYNAVNTEISNQGGTALTDHTQMRFFKVLNSSNPFNVGSLLESDGIDLEHGTASSTQWSYSTFGSDHYGEFYVEGFSGGGGGGASGGAPLLPIELLYFRGEALDQSNQITWATASEENTELHLIEYSNGIDDWKVIGQREAAGFSSQTIYYEFSDHSPSTIGYYRLKSVDFDGAFQVSNTIAIERESDHFELLNVYPIPTESNLGINFNLANKSLITVTLTDLSGRMVTVQKHDGTAGVNRINLDLSQLNAGMYFVQIDNGKEKLQRRIVKQ